MNMRAHFQRLGARRLLAIAATIALVPLSGCGGDADEASDAAPEAPAASDTPAAGASAEPAIPQSGTGVKGKVTFEGTPPPRAELELAGDPKCAVMHEGSPLLAETVLVGPDGGLKNVFLSLSEAPEGDYPAPATPALLDQVGCQYTPHVLGVIVGQEIEIRNSDPTTHNVRAYARKNRPFNIGQPADAKPRIKSFKKQEDAIRMKCDVHPWMQAYVFAMEHPYFAVSNSSGEFAIVDLPAGEYTVTAWHEKLGEQEGTATVEDGKLTALNFSFSQ